MRLHRRFFIELVHMNRECISMGTGKRFRGPQTKKEPTWHNMRKGQEPQEEGV